jgi:NCS1 family nucleobase:cation symporter-1
MDHAMTITDAPIAGPAEAPLVLDTDPPRSLSFTDQAAFWGNLGVSLIGFSGAIYVLTPAGHAQLPVSAALLALVVGTLIGTAMVALVGAVGARTGAPAMAVLRGLFGTRLSYVPTVANIVQCVGWGVFELTVIASGVKALTHDSWPHAPVIVAAGALCTAMAIWPLRMLRVLRKYVTVAVGVAMRDFSVQLFRQPIPPQHGTSWEGFFPAVDSSLAVAVSFVPLAADYTRHAKSARAATGATMLGYSIAQVWCYLLGMVALLQAGSADNIFDTFVGVTAGWLFFAVLVLRESDQSFANVYSTAMSLQNLLPKVDRRILAGGVGLVVTLLALPVHDFTGFQNFLYLIGSVFVPLAAVLVVDYFFGRGRSAGGWNLAEDAPSRWVMLLPWLFGFAVYQVFNPGSIDWWANFWVKVEDAIGVHPGWWSSASLFSFVAAASATGAIVVFERRNHG